jgi:transcriptional regulator with XRE-family HTH domain
MNSLPQLGRAAAELRKQRDMTQKELASLSGLGLSTLARFETGGVAEFGSRKLLRLLEVLGHELVFAAGPSAFTLDDALAERQSAAASLSSSRVQTSTSKTRRLSTCP